MMRKLKLQVQISVDIFISGPKGEMDWMVFNWDDELKKYVNEITNLVDSIVLGRNLAQGFIPHWASKPVGEDQWFIEKINNSKKVVFTKTLEKSEWDNTVLAKDNLVEEINELKNQNGKDIIAYGRGTFVSALNATGLTDEFNLFLNPVALGTGMTIFKELKGKQKFALRESRAFPFGVTLIRYETAT